MKGNVSASRLWQPDYRHVTDKFRSTTSARRSRSNRILFVKRWAQFFATLILLLFATGQISAGESLQGSINYLLDYVAKSDAIFIRNGETHTPQEAVNHIKAKYEHFKSEIKTPEDFIRLSASKSLLSGQPYLVRTKDGKEMRLDTWLTEALKAHRVEAGH